MKASASTKIQLILLLGIIPGLSSSYSSAGAPRTDPNLLNQILDGRLDGGFNVSRCSNPSGSLDSAILVETEDGEMQDFTTVQVRTDLTD